MRTGEGKTKQSKVWVKKTPGTGRWDGPDDWIGRTVGG